MSWKEYEIDESDVSEWLPWGGLVRSSVMRNKDNSFFGVIEYTPYRPDASRKMNYHPYKNGWSIWSEKQHYQGVDHYFLTVTWNPFYSGSSIKNTLIDSSIEEKQATDYFLNEMNFLRNSIAEITSCHLLEYQEILDFLSFTLSLGQNSVTMPSIPLYLDVVLSRKVKVDFFENEIAINGNKVLILNLPSIPNAAMISILFKAFENYNYRYVQRLLIFDKKAAQEDLDKYVANWCSGRKSLRQSMTANIISNLNGYYASSFIFHLNEDTYDDVRAYCQEVLDVLEVPYLFELFNLKDVWWGSLPGIFRANINAPIVGFSGIEDLMLSNLGEEV